jgi:hypothetical protein
MKRLWHRLRIRRTPERSPDESFGLLALLRRVGAL